MRVTVHLPMPLRPLVGNKPRVRVDVDGATVADLLVELRREHAALAAVLLDEEGALRRHVTLYVGEDDARYAGGGQGALGADVHLVVPLVV